MKHRVAFLHTSPPAIAPLMQFYSREAPEFEIVNLLDDGLLQHFREGESSAAESALLELVARVYTKYQVQAAMLTCSAVSAAMLRSLQQASPVPLLKVDVPMAAAAATLGRRIGVAYTFAPTLEPTTALFGSDVEVLPRLVTGAYEALLAGRMDEHDNLVLAGLETFLPHAEVIVLAQVSMARVLPRLRADFPVPVLSSLETSLTALRKVFA